MEIEELLNDNEFVAQMEAAKNLEELASLLNVRGIEATAEELENALKANDSELDETSLDNVAGGSVVLLAGAVAVGVAILWASKHPTCILRKNK